LVQSILQRGAVTSLGLQPVPPSNAGLSAAFAAAHAVASPCARICGLAGRSGDGTGAPISGREAAAALSFISMSALRAHVQNGHVVLDEPTELPEGTAVEIDGLRVLDENDGFSTLERQKILRGIDEGLAAIARGEYVDAEAFVDELIAEP
jgi:hypothetical protein